jgi:hypothetical protein
MANYNTPVEQAASCLEAYFAGIIEKNYADASKLDGLTSANYQKNQVDEIYNLSIQNLADKYTEEARLSSEFNKTSTLILNAKKLDTESSLSLLPAEIIEQILVAAPTLPSNHLSRLVGFTDSFRVWIETKLKREMIGISEIRGSDLLIEMYTNRLKTDSDTINTEYLEPNDWM